jgi:hypothetical protein
LGDYLDNYENTSPVEQLNNLSEIIEFKKSNRDKVILLIGNHDYHYISDDRYSGYQHVSAHLYRDLLKRELKNFQICYKPSENIICSHAGISKVFLDRFGIKEDENLDKNLNILFSLRPDSFKFVGEDIHGDSPESSPIWIRIRSLLKYGVKLTQIVGHTMTTEVKKIENIYLIDTLGTSRQYLKIDDDDNICICSLDKSFKEDSLTFSSVS